MLWLTGGVCVNRITQGHRRLMIEARALSDIGRNDFALEVIAGLDLGPTTVREIALSILSEIAAVRSGRLGQPLREGTERIMR